MQVTCHYCGELAEFVTGEAIYPHRTDLHKKHFYQCQPCGAYVGCHQNTNKPLGILANAELRQAKKEAHASFDPLWRNGAMKRREAYRLLAEWLNVEPKNCHIGMFDIDMCNRVVNFTNDYKDHSQ